MTQIQVPARFNGPPDVVNGGYACASVAAAIDGVAEVTLRRPVPVDTPLALAREAERATLTAPDGTLLAEAVPGVFTPVPVPPVSFADATAAMALGPTRIHGEFGFPCFVCNPTRADGFCVTPGPVAGRNVVAATWTPDAELIAEGEAVDPRFIWAVLDCTGSIGAMVAHTIPQGVLLGRMTATVDVPLRAGEPYIAVGWSDPADGRKLPAYAALFDASSRAVAHARLLCFPPK